MNQEEGKMKKYKVRRYSVNEYEVYDSEDGYQHSEFHGSIADCEAWIRLTEDGRL